MAENNLILYQKSLNEGFSVISLIMFSKKGKNKIKCFTYFT